jgi:hypothetical protein
MHGTRWVLGQEMRVAEASLAAAAADDLLGVTHAAMLEDGAAGRVGERRALRVDEVSWPTTTCLFLGALAVNPGSANWQLYWLSLPAFMGEPKIVSASDFMRKSQGFLPCA